jgi:hypothetical protein
LGSKLHKNIVKVYDELKPGSLKNYVISDECDRIRSLEIKV